ncbi:MAG: hypothetical protein IH586_09445 [Anaerolineaceae bacterium]|nr:hypothetical protein [Anaerolineaceae bacterium]
MIPFGLLSKESRDAQRPPRLVRLANKEILSRAVPTQVKPRQAAKDPKRNNPNSEMNYQVKNAWKSSPLVQLPVDTVRFPNPANRPIPPTVNGNGKAGHQVEQKPGNYPSSVINRTAIPPVPGDRANPTILPEKKLTNNEQPGEISRQPQEIKTFSPEKPTIPINFEKPGGNSVNGVRVQPNLEDLLAKNANLPSQAVVLGICEDGLPLALDLYDPTPGSLLALGDLRDEQIGLLRTAISSACLRNTPRTIQFLVFSHQPDVWKAWVAQHGFERHCISIESAQEDTLRESILLLADWTEQRRLGRRSGPPILLVIDTLTFLPRLEYDIRLNFDWLVKEGPPAQIWTIAAISTDLASSLGPRMLRSFQGKILGCVKEPGIYSRLVGLDQEQASIFKQPGTFAVCVGESWLHFQLPSQ